ncbi:MAG: DM13 domain-containing protein [Anaerolineae bacterium]|jgi:hypothetical protein|nr:DM13 domain-containing protein [Anaerolineae bacterium]
MEIRLRLTMLGLLLLLVLAVWAFPAWYPLVNQNTVSNPFPGLEEAAWLDYLALPETVREAFERLRDGDEDLELPPQPEAALALVRARLLRQDIPAPADEQSYTPPEGSSIVRQGAFAPVDAIRGATGTLTIYALPDQTRILRIENLAASRAPEVHVIFTRNPDPLDPRGVGVDYIDLGPLKGETGSMTYVVPAGVDFGVYPILALYSVSYRVVISTATLR